MYRGSLRMGTLALCILLATTCSALASPTVLSRTPSQLFNVPTSSAIGVRFSEAMDPSTIVYGDAGTVRLYMKTAGASSLAIHARLELTRVLYADGTQHVVGFHLYPSGGNLANTEHYFVTIKGGPEGVKSELGVPMVETYTWHWHTTSWTLANGHFASGLANWRAIHRPASETLPGTITVEAVKNEADRLHPHVAAARRILADHPGMAGVEQGLADLISPADMETGVSLSAEVLRLHDAANAGVRMEVEVMRMTSTGPVHRFWGATFFPPLPTTDRPAAWMPIRSPNLIPALEMHAGDRIETVRIFINGTVFNVLIDNVRLGPPPVTSPV